MEQVHNFADGRLTVGCAYCGGYDDTRDHVPSRVLLEPPFPENLPVVYACNSCNNSFSRDEEYFACMVEAVLAGSTDPEAIQRPSVASIFRHAHALRARLEAARRNVGDRVVFDVEAERIKNVVLKLARGHAVFELSQACRKEPSRVWWCPLAEMSDADRGAFEEGYYIDLFGEVGSRQSQRAFVVQAVLRPDRGEEQGFGFLMVDWIEVQEGIYRYLAIDDPKAITIKIVVREYLACGATWER